MAAATIWRYMQYWKFESMLGNRGLYFPNVVSCPDQLEGSIPLANAERRRERIDAAFREDKPFYESWLHAYRVLSVSGHRFEEPSAEAYADAQSGRAAKTRDDLIQNKSPEEALAVWRYIYEAAAKSLRWWRQYVFVSCWYGGGQESPEMWREYPSESVCVRSDVERLRSQLPGNIAIKPVEYIDHATHVIPELEAPAYTAELLYQYKDRSLFGHEHEIRAIFEKAELISGPADPPDKPLPRRCMWVPVDLNVLIAEVLVSPTADESFLRRVKRDCAAQGLTAPVERSALTVARRGAGGEIRSGT